MNCNGKILDIQKPLVMGILNITTDSFFDGGKYTLPEKMLFHTRKMLDDGAGIIDIGANSSRPGAIAVNETGEGNTIKKALRVLVKEFPSVVFSVDTFRSSVARIAIQEGAGIINDISGGSLDGNMFETVAGLEVPYILMHMQDTPENMQLDPRYEDVVQEVLDFFLAKTREARSAGIKDIIIDPGFGFGKTMEHNYQLLKNMALFGKFELPILAGVSRKAMVNRVIGTTPEQALNGTTVLNTLALLNGAVILRVHDVKEAVETIKLVEQYKKSS